MTASSLDELEGELPIRERSRFCEPPALDLTLPVPDLEPTDALGVVFALQVKPLLASNQGPPRMPSLVIVWRRYVFSPPIHPLFLESPVKHIRSPIEVLVTPQFGLS